MEDTILQTKCDAFAVRIYQLDKYLQTCKEFSIASQILRSGTSIGANIAETPNAESTDDFIHKIAIARKEANETQYWLRLLHNVQLIDDSLFNSMKADCTELQRIMAATIKSLIAKKQTDSSADNN